MFKILTSEAILVRKCFLRSSTIVLSSNNKLIPSNHQQKRNFTQEIWTSLSQSKPVAILQDASIQLHDMSGLPWWSTIIVSTILLRGCLTLPLALYQNKILAKVEKLATVDMPELAKELKMETHFAVKKFNWDERTAKIMYSRSLKKQWSELLARDNCHPAKSFIVILFQLPLWIGQSCALRNMLFMLPDPSAVTAQVVCAEMQLGGVAWFPNLIEYDHSFILPVTLGILNLIIVEVNF